MSDEKKAETPTKEVSVKELKASERKWGKAVIGQGYTILPSLLFKAQRRLGLNPTQLAVLVQLADFWWAVDRKPFPAKKTLSERLGLGTRQIQRILADLEQAGLVTRVERSSAYHGKQSNEYDLSGLVEKLKKLAPDFARANEEVKEKKRSVSRPRAGNK